MSGGHFDYDCFTISQFAETLQHEIDINGSEEKDEWGLTIGYGYDKQTMEVVKESQRIIKIAGDLAKELEWLYSGDCGEESFLKLAKPIMKRLYDGRKTNY